LSKKLKPTHRDNNTLLHQITKQNNTKTKQHNKQSKRMSAPNNNLSIDERMERARGRPFLLSGLIGNIRRGQLQAQEEARAQAQANQGRATSCRLHPQNQRLIDEHRSRAFEVIGNIRRGQLQAQEEARAQAQANQGRATSSRLHPQNQRLIDEHRRAFEDQMQRVEGQMQQVEGQMQRRVNSLFVYEDSPLICTTGWQTTEIPVEIPVESMPALNQCVISAMSHL
jgi:hypothetical protein